MIVQILSLLLILILAAYLSGQGMMTAIMVFVAAAFASVAAIGLHETLGAPISNWRPEYGRGVAFLVTFFLVFSVLRVVSDIVVPKGVKLPTIADRLGGGIVGLFAALVVVGSIIIGIEMLPVGSKYLGFDRFPGEKGMQAVDATGQPIPGIAAAPRSTWLGAENFTLGLYNTMTGGSMGGRNTFAAVHPRFITELYGKRHTVQAGSSQATLGELVTMPSVQWINSKPTMAKLGLKNTDDVRALMVRLKIDQGTTQPRIGSDADGYFRITPTQVRLVTHDGQLLYPVAFMDKGQAAEPIELGKSHYVLDAGAGYAVVTDWVFSLPENSLPRFVEYKQLARIPFSEELKPSETYVAASEVDYSPRKYRDNPATVTFQFAEVSATGNRTPLKDVQIFIVQAATKKREVDAEVTEAARALEVKSADWTENRNGWGEHLRDQPGIIDGLQIRMASQQAMNIRTGPMEELVQLENLVPLMLISQASPSGPRNIEALDKFFSDQVVPMLKKFELASGQSSDQGVFTKKISKGTYAYIARVKTGDSFYLWTGMLQAEAKANLKPEVTSKNARLALSLKPK